MGKAFQFSDFNVQPGSCATRRLNSEAVQLHKSGKNIPVQKQTAST